ncbi:MULTISPECIES: ABC transporter substrate-binding protein [Streptomyces]|jgi:glycine betaine/proline transport system substrate-binding protein|uniref:Glycine betaine/proline transport system substrate-binding protein n=1 Tax=Streptomyces radiopugnans TaxID=403935 RepID=A0A1H9HVE7_9ACTN|nr:ABC transporter substrate-binding protein [Streptomyces radiopugnans]URN13003.1 ABC transporter substrate-binding protein [Streptomyces radiopugnans]SEQ66290.1 glycine betaine/proline transport system substrate-binding protein [Streptomyces radiopugnans]
MNTGKNSRRVRTTLAAGSAVLGMAALSACGAADTSASASSGGGDTVTIAVPSWVGAEANAAVAKHILEEELDVKVKLQQMDEPVAWDALDSGKVDAILEDWGGVPKKEKRYIEERKTVVEAGDLGVTGHIGWFVPKYFADENPDVTDWKNLNKYADELKTTESGGKGQLLEGSPSYTTNDDAIIKNLDLDLKTVYAGSEAAQITQIKKYVKEKKPFLTYWWTPQWLNAEIDFVEVKLPEYTEGCDADPEKVACAYPETPLQKYLNADFAKDGGDAAQFLKNFNWSTEQQNQVAKWIAGDGMSAEDAAAKWAKENKSTWEKWLP